MQESVSECCAGGQADAGRRAGWRARRAEARPVTAGPGGWGFGAVSAREPPAAVRVAAPRRRGAGAQERVSRSGSEEREGREEQGKEERKIGRAHV